MAIVAAGLEQGLGRDAIAGELEQAARAALVERAPFYWELVASSFVGQGRSFPQMSGYAEAGIQRYRIEAVLDERTTHICRHLHGETFEVADALQHFERVEAMEKPEDITRELPWVREGRDAETGRTRLYVEGKAVRMMIAEVTHSAIGSRDDVGDFRPLASDRELAEAGVGFPPFHTLCRSTCLAA